MRVTWRHKSKKGWNATKRWAVLNALNFVAEWYGLEQENLHITLKMCNFDHFGDCVAKKEGHYILRLSGKYPVVELIKTIFHEMTHVEQYESGRLEAQVLNIHPDGTATVDTHWDGRFYSSNEQSTLWSYYSPWEREARKMEKKIWKQYRKYVLEFINE